MSDYAGKGTIVVITASKTLAGLPQTITDFPADQDPISFDDLNVGDMELGANGDAGTWELSEPAVVTLSVMANGLGHSIMSTFLQANRSSAGKISARDKFTLTRISPNGSILVATGGVFASGSPVSGLSGNGKNKTVSFKFKFADFDDTVVPVVD